MSSGLYVIMNDQEKVSRVVHDIQYMYFEHFRRDHCLLRSRTC